MDSDKEENSNDPKAVLAGIAKECADDIEREETFKQLVIGPLIQSSFWIACSIAVLWLTLWHPIKYDWVLYGCATLIGGLTIFMNLMCIRMIKLVTKIRIKLKLDGRTFALQMRDAL